MYIKLFMFLLLATLISCKGDSVVKSNYSDLDLMSYGMPIKVKAPLDAKVVSDDLGIIQDISIKGKDNYFLQIIAGQAFETNIKELINKQKQSVEKMKYFTKIIEEDESGFIFEKKFSEDRINYDFRIVKIQGDKEYIFQAGLMGQFTIDDIKRMYNSVK